MATIIHATRPTEARTRLIRTRPYAVLGGLVAIGLLIVAVLGYFGVIPSDGIYSTNAEAFFVIGAALVILASALVYLFLTLRDTIDVRVQDRLTKMQVQRDGTQDLRITSLERGSGTHGLSEQVARAETRISSLEGARVSAGEGLSAQLARTEARLASLEHTPGTNGLSAQVARAETRISSLEGTRVSAGEGLSAQSARTEARLSSLEHTPGTDGLGAQLARAESRISSLEGARGNEYDSISSQIARLEDCIAILERARATSSTVSVVPAHGPAAARPAVGVRAHAPAARKAEKSLFGDVSPVIDVEGIGPVYAEALKGMGIHDTRQLWEANAAQVASHIDAPVSVVHKWQQMAELIAVKGIGPQYAELLQRSGVGSIAELKASKPEALLASVSRTQDALGVRIQGNTIGEAGVTHWIQAARNHHGG